MIDQSTNEKSNERKRERGKKIKFCSNSNPIKEPRKTFFAMEMPDCFFSCMSLILRRIICSFVPKLEKGKI